MKISLPQSIQHKTRGKGLVLFDGECGFCAAIVRFILKHDSDAYFVFAPLQSQWLTEILPERYKNLSTLLLVENEELYDRSTAALRIAKRLDGSVSLLGSLSFLPRSLRDWGYDRVAEKRHLLLGPDKCELLSTAERDRFL